MLTFCKVRIFCQLTPNSIAELKKPAPPKTSDRPSTWSGLGDASTPVPSPGGCAQPFRLRALNPAKWGSGFPGASTGNPMWLVPLYRGPVGRWGEMLVSHLASGGSPHLCGPDGTCSVLPDCLCRVSSCASLVPARLARTAPTLTQWACTAPTRILLPCPASALPLPTLPSTAYPLWGLLSPLS